MKTTLAALAATVALIALGQGMQENAGSARADMNYPNDYLLISGDVECRITQGAVREKVARLDIEPGCTAALDPIAPAAMIEENDDGTIDFLGADGKAVIRFAAAEGDTHVSYEPQAPLVRLVALD
ncbi:hypothetical protein GTW25_12605 [Aliihoeflea aestuarii]|jgi:hypothetical protein|uniref:hypothetical protein n=1 Tax=Aliihoeflea aestuarii TaxID=453840 RepID=UPI0020925E62|nr:hypothetical protein [Aliihoeflea aestuarii]MCO6391871.1 hypothetical protein [Aliihoeflea aestuarii]